METYDEIYQRMKSKYCELSGFEIDDVSDIAIRLRVLAGEIYNAQTNYEWLKNQIFVSTASGEYLDYLALQRGLSRKAAAKAVGKLNFCMFEEKEYDVVIPKGTVVSTTDNEPIRFATTVDSYIPAGELEIYVSAEAEDAGSSGNIFEHRAIVSVSVPADIDLVTNTEKFEGGIDEESDENLRMRVSATLTRPANGTNAAFYESLVLSVEGITKVKVQKTGRGVGTVDIYVCNEGQKAEEAAVEKAQKLVDENRELNVDAKVMAANPVEYDFYAAVTAKSGYTAEHVENQCRRAFENCLAATPIGSVVYLSNLGSYLMNTGCIENYVFDEFMGGAAPSNSQFYVPGSFDIEVS